MTNNTMQHCTTSYAFFGSYLVFLEKGMVFWYNVENGTRGKNVGNQWVKQSTGNWQAFVDHNVIVDEPAS